MTTGGGGHPRPGAIVRRLLDAGVLRAADVVDGEVVLSDLSQSNCVYALDDATGRALVVKAGRGERPLDQGSREREHQLYRAVADHPAVAAEAPVPELVADLGDVLVLRRVSRGDTLGARYRDGGLAAIDGAALGRAIGTWHRLGDVLLTADPSWAGRGRLPWVMRSLTMDRAELASLHPPLAELADRLRETGPLVEVVEQAAAAWRPDALVHGDVRWDNALVAGDGPAVTLVDWEFADHGDAGWDLASAVVEAVVAAYVDEGKADLDVVIRAVAGHVEDVIGGYCSARGEGAADAVAAAARLAPVRLLLAAFQHAAWIPFTGVETGAGLGRFAAQLAEDPQRLLGLPVPAAR